MDIFAVQRTGCNQHKARIEAPAVLVALLVVLAWSSKAEPTSTPTPPAGMLLTDSMGRSVEVPTNAIPARLLQPATFDQNHQIPQPTRGARQPDAVRRRLEAGRADEDGLLLFPSVQPHLMSYLADLDEFGNTVLRPRALFDVGPLEPEVQHIKYGLSNHGLRYSLEQTLTGVGLSKVQQGSRELGYYTLNLQAKWAVYDMPDSTAGWLSTHLNIKSGLGASGADQSAASNLGTVTEPSGIWSPVNGVRLSELAWQQSLRDGEVVIVAGVVNQGDYMDVNAYANNGRSQFFNSALIDSQVLPLPGYNFGLNLQWQPHADWYGLLGTSVGNASAGQVPWTDFSLNTWSVLGEVGYAPEDFLGWGPGVLRIQPFIAQADGPVQGGLGFNVQQQLGQQSPFGWFGRFGFGGSSVAAGASTQIGTGFVVYSPLQRLQVWAESNEDLFGIGFVWSQPSATDRTIYHENEYILETFYALQLTPLMKLQPDVQVVWNSAFNPDTGPATVLQLQLALAW